MTQFTARYITLVNNMINKLILAAILVCSSAYADTVKIVVPYAPGGISDKTARALEQVLVKHTPHTYVVEYKPGAGGAIGASALANDKTKDTVLMVASLGVLINSVMPGSTYNMKSDFIGVAYLGSVQAVAMTSNKSGLNSIQKLVSSKQTVFFGSSGINSATHISGEILKQNTNMPAEHVPYKGEAAAMSDLLAGNVQLLIGSAGLAQPYYGTDKINIVAVSGNKRNADMPDIPTFAEAGIKGFDVTPNWGLLLANKNADPKIIAEVRTALAESLKTVEGAEHFKQVGLDTNRKQLYNTQEFITSEEVRMKKLLQKINLGN